MSDLIDSLAYVIGPLEEDGMPEAQALMTELAQRHLASILNPIAEDIMGLDPNQKGQQRWTVRLHPNEVEHATRWAAQYLKQRRELGMVEGYDSGLSCPIVSANCPLFDCDGDLEIDPGPGRVHCSESVCHLFHGVTFELIESVGLEAALAHAARRPVPAFIAPPGEDELRSVGPQVAQYGLGPILGSYGGGGAAQGGGLGDRALPYPPGAVMVNHYLTDPSEAEMFPGARKLAAERKDWPWEAASNIVVPKCDGLDLGAAAAAEGAAILGADGPERLATLRDVWDVLQKPAQSDSERAERLLDRFRIVHK